MKNCNKINYLIDCAVKAKSSSGGGAETPDEERGGCPVLTPNWNKRLRSYACAVILLFMFGCTTSHPYEKVKDSSAVISLSGFSISPPDGKGWYRGKNDNKRIIFARKGDNRTQSLIAMALVHNLPDVTSDSEDEFLKMVSKIRRRKNNKSRFKNILKEETVSHEKSTFTVRFHTKYKDYGAKNMPKSVKYMVTEDIGILWRHPENKNIGLTIGLSQRHLEGDPVKDFKKITDEFIKSANIEPL
jgi:hypothetical protein